MRVRSGVTPHVVLVLIGWLCAAGQADAQPRTVRSTAPPAWGENLRLVEEVRIGALDGAEEYTFGMIMGVSAGARGEIYVADNHGPVIRMYDASGRFVRNIGRAGGGPGEYRTVGGMRVLPDGRLAVWDQRGARILIYSAAGEYAASHTVSTGFFGNDMFEVDLHGRFYVRTVIHDPAQGPMTDTPDAWIRVDRDGRVMDTIPVPRDPQRSSSFVLSGPSGFERPFTRELVVTLSRLGYFITGRNDSYAFELHAPDAPLRIERAYTPVRVSAAERAEWQAWARLFERRAANPPPSTANVINPPPRRLQVTIPDTKPAFSALRTDAQGRIWVRRYVQAQNRPGPAREPGDERPRRTWREPPTWDAFEPSGRLLGTMVMPWNAYLYDARDRHIWATVRGEFDETYVVRLRIEGR